MKKTIALFIALILLIFSTVTAFAADGNAVYHSNAKEFVFSPGSEYSPTDLFPNFKDVMPGDTLTQKITVKNDADKGVKVKIYMRSLGAHENSVEFLSKLGLRVQKSEDNKMAYMFDANADKTAQLTDWVLLGTLYSGGEVNLDVILDVPVELNNDFQKLVGFLDWEFMVQEFPTETTDPKPPKTGDDSNIGIVLAVMVCALTVMIILLIWRKKQNNAEENQK